MRFEREGLSNARLCVEVRVVLHEREAPISSRLPPGHKVLFRLCLGSVAPMGAGSRSRLWKNGVDYTNASRTARAKRVEEKWHSVNEVSLEEPGRGRALPFTFDGKDLGFHLPRLCWTPSHKTRAGWQTTSPSRTWCRKHGVDVLATGRTLSLG